MLEYYLAILFIILVLISGLMGYKIPLIGLIGMVFGLILLVPLAITPTVIIGMRVETTTGTTIAVTQEIIELRIICIIVMLICVTSTILGMLDKL